MLWEDKVEAWKKHPVTKSFFEEIHLDTEQLKQALVKEDDLTKMYRIQGMLRALGGVVDILTDGIPEHKEKGVNDVSSF